MDTSAVDIEETLRIEGYKFALKQLTVSRFSKTIHTEIRSVLYSAAMVQTKKLGTKKEEDAWAYFVEEVVRQRKNFYPRFFPLIEDDSSGIIIPSSWVKALEFQDTKFTKKDLTVKQSSFRLRPESCRALPK